MVMLIVIISMIAMITEKMMIMIPINKEKSW